MIITGTHCMYCCGHCVRKLDDVIHDIVVILCTDVYVHSTGVNVSSQGLTVRDD